MWLRGPFSRGSAVRTALQMKICWRSILTISLALLILGATFTSARPRHSSRRHSGGHNHRHRKNPFKMPALSENGLPMPISYHLVFSQTKPTQPPWELLMNSSSPNEEEENFSRTSGPHHGHRSKRAEPFQTVCPDIGDWVILTHTKDIYDQDVEVLQGISVGGVRMDQYFYETRCAQANMPCRGIDSNQFQSVCQNKYIWTYGYVRKSTGEEGWCQIRINGSCNCAIKQRVYTAGPSVSLLDFL